MKIIEFTGENFRCLKAVCIRPNGNMIQVTGANGHGKTSVLDGLWALLKGRAVAGPEPIRRGAERALLSALIGNGKPKWSVERTFRRVKGGELTTDLRVTEIHEDGTTRQVRSPQAVLDGFLSALSFDPLAFARAKPAEQFETLRKFAPDFDFEANSAERKRLFDLRTNIGRDRDRALGAAQVAKASLPEGPKPERVDVQDLLRQLDEITAATTQHQMRESRRNEMTRKVENLKDCIEEMQAQIATLERQLDAMPAARELPNPAPIRAMLDNAKNVEKVVEQFERCEQHVKDGAAFSMQWDELTNQIGNLDIERKAAVERAKMPVEGLTLGDGCVLYNGLPFEQASASQRLIVSTTVAMAANPDLRIIRTYDGGLLDSTSLGTIAALAKSRDYQCWIEKVDESGQVGFYMVDGEVTNVDEHA